MIECRRIPSCRRVALRTVVTEVAGHVIRIRRSVEVRRVTLVAVRIMQLIIAIHMAIDAGRRHMSTRQSKRRGRVIERRGLPHRCAVTLCAVMTEIVRHVIGIRRTLEICSVALIAIGVMELIIAIHMTGLAGG